MVGRIEVLLRDAGVGVGDRVVAWPIQPRPMGPMLACAGLGAVFASTSPTSQGRWRDRSFRADRADLAVLGSGLHLQRQTPAGELHEIVRRPIPSCIDRRRARLARRSRVDTDHVCAVAVRSPVVRAVLVGHHRQAQVHRAPRRWCAAEATAEHIPIPISAPATRWSTTTAGWMMWNWLASGTLERRWCCLTARDGTGRTGSSITDEVGVTFFGTSAFSTRANAGIRPPTPMISAVRTLASTGSTLSPRAFGSCTTHQVDLPGLRGTDLAAVCDRQPDVAGARRGDPGARTRPCRRRRDSGEPSVPVGVEGVGVVLRSRRCRCVSNDRYPLRRRLLRSVRGPLAPWRFHLDKRGRRVRRFRAFDATLNPGGVRIGTAEIYRQVVAMAEIEESVVVGQPWGDTRIVLFVKMAAGHDLDDQLWIAFAARSAAR